MANGTKAQGWTPANEVEAGKAVLGDVYKGMDGKFYQHENISKATPRNPPAPAPHPQATPPATKESGPSSADLDAVAAEEAAKHATAAPPSLVSPPAPKAAPGGPTNPSYDADKLDSTGKNEKSGVTPGPRGVNQPADVMSDEERAQAGIQQEARLSKNMSSTHSVDSIGAKKGAFEVTPQGLDKHGARIPDKVDYDKPVDPLPAQVGPRGIGAPKDTFHKQ
jgi:hypothetical protein